MIVIGGSVLDLRTFEARSIINRFLQLQLVLHQTGTLQIPRHRLVLIPRTTTRGRKSSSSARTSYTLEVDRRNGSLKGGRGRISKVRYKGPPCRHLPEATQTRSY